MIRFRFNDASKTKYLKMEGIENTHQHMQPKELYKRDVSTMSTQRSFPIHNTNESLACFSQHVFIYM